jgi:hypothetical protein
MATQLSILHTINWSGYRKLNQDSDDDDADDTDLSEYVNMCKKNINDIKKVPKDCATMELINKIDSRKLWKIMNMQILNNVAPDVQDYFIKNEWLVNSSFKGKCSGPWSRNDINHSKYQELLFKIIDNIFALETKAEADDVIPQAVARDQTLLSYIIDRIVSDKLVNFPVSIFKGVELTIEQFNKLSSVYKIQKVYISDSVTQ